MKLNCKPGELCVIVGGRVDSVIGKIVKTVRLDPIFNDPPCWILDEPIYDLHGREVAPRDATMRPIRDQPGEDETLTWAPVPHKETV